MTLEGYATPDPGGGYRPGPEHGPGHVAGFGSHPLGNHWLDCQGSMLVQTTGGLPCTTYEAGRRWTGQCALPLLPPGGALFGSGSENAKARSCPFSERPQGMHRYRALRETDQEGFVEADRLNRIDVEARPAARNVEGRLVSVLELEKNFLHGAPMCVVH